MVRKLLITILLVFATYTYAQQPLSLDSCRQMALRNNKKISIARLNTDIARDTRRAAKTKYLPHIDFVGGYEYVSKEISILSENQKNVIANIGSAATGQMSGTLQSFLSDMAVQGVVTPQEAQAIGQIANKYMPEIQNSGNALGQQIVDAFKTDTKHSFGAALMLTQPIYTGGRITAANKITEIGIGLSEEALDDCRQSTIWEIDNAYWTVVSLKNKERLADSYLQLIKKLYDDVQKMITEGVATRADGLKVDVKMNEAEMQLTQIQNATSLAKMLLCRLCGIPISGEISLADENNSEIFVKNDFVEDNINSVDIQYARENRTEVKMLDKVMQISHQKTKMAKAERLPQIALTGGYMVSNPNVYDGFQRKFKGIWNVGVMIKMPIWDWMEGAYKVRTSRTAACIAAMELEDAKDLVELQVNQGAFKLTEAHKRQSLAERNITHAEENLRCANLGFKEGVMEVTDVMAAQTAWLKAHSQKIDADIDIILSKTNMKKVLGERIF